MKPISLYGRLAKHGSNGFRATAGMMIFFMFFGYGPIRELSAHGAGEVAHLGGHLNEYEDEMTKLAESVDAMVQAWRKGKSAKEKWEDLIEVWESVEVHEAIETRAVSFYPPIWQGIYALRQAMEMTDNETAMVDAAARTKAALWESMGAIRLLAEQEVHGEMVPGINRESAIETGDDPFPAPLAKGNRIELTGNDSMRFNRDQFKVKAGERVTLVLKNIGELPREVMGHNVVILKRGEPVEPFGVAAAEAPENDFIPTGAGHREAMVAHTRLLGPGEEDRITFTLPEPGDYPFLCSFTAHFRLMNGIIRAVPADLPDSESGDPIAALLKQLEKAVSAYESGNVERGLSLVQAAYFDIFEKLESDLNKLNPNLTRQLELDFNAGLPSLFQENASMEKVQAQLKAMKSRLETAKTLLGKPRGSVHVF